MPQLPTQFAMGGFTIREAGNGDEVASFANHAEPRAFSFTGRDDHRIILFSRTIGQVTVGGASTSGHRAVLEESKSLSFIVVMRGGGVVRSGNYLQRVGPDHAVVSQAGESRISVALPGTTYAVIEVPPLHGVSAEPLEPGVVVADRSGAIRRAMAGMWPIFASETDTQTAGRAASHWLPTLQDLARRLFEATGGGSAAAGGLRHVRQAEEMMRADYASPFSVAEAAEKLGLTPRALQFAFAKYRGRSPRQALDLIRMAAAHDRLTAPVKGTSVKAVALDCGLPHFGRFAMAYRNLYGEPPSATLERSNAASGAPGRHMGMAD